jgi:uncharacterized Tic20 family protein
MGALAHLFGPLVAIIVWSTQKEKSKFVKFQALQALAFDIFLVAMMGFLFFCFFGVIFVGMFGTMFGVLESTSTPDGVTPFFILPFMFPMLMFVCIFPLSLLIMVARLTASFAVLNGRNYQYPVIGKWLENFLKE